MKNKGTKWIFTAIALAFSLAFNVAAWESRAFADFYTDRIFPVITLPYAALTSLLPFSFGEMLLVIGLFLVAALIVTLILRKFFLW